MSILDGENMILHAIVVNGVHTPGTAAAVKANSKPGSVFQFTAKYTISARGLHFSFRKNQTVSLPPDLLAALQAVNAPMVAL